MIGRSVKPYLVVWDEDIFTKILRPVVKILVLLDFQGI